MKKQIGVYVVTADFDSLEGWDISGSAGVARELLVPLSDLGVCVKYIPRQIGGGGFYPYIDKLDPRVTLRINKTVEDIIERGPL